MTPGLEQAVKQLIMQYGRGILSEPRRLQAMLQDTYNGNRREIRLMVTIAEEGVLGEVLKDSSDRVEKQIFARLVNKLHHDTGMDTALIEDALTSWIHILDKTPPPRVQSHVKQISQPISLTQQPSSTAKQIVAVVQQQYTQPMQPPIQQGKQSPAASMTGVSKKQVQSSIPIWKLVIAMVIAVGLIKLFTPWLDGSNSTSEQRDQAAVNAIAEAKEKTQLPSETTVTTSPTNSTKTEELSVSYEQMSSFMERYHKLSVEAINTNNFSLVEPYLDKSGKSYTEQSDYIAYLDRKGIKERLVNQKIRKVTKLDSNTYDVKTYEEYNIYYSDGTSKFKSFNSSYTVKIINSKLLIRSLDRNDQLESRDL